MLHKKILHVSIFLLLSWLLIVGTAVSQGLQGNTANTNIKAGTIPQSVKIEVPRIKQLTNYCGPATLSAVLKSLGSDVAQETVGKAVFDPGSKATNGADMLYYARDKGYDAYSWNTSINDLKHKLAAGSPVILLQQNSEKDTSGHYRVMTGYDDNRKVFYVMDPYYDFTEMSYTSTQQLSQRMGFWALVVVPKDKNNFKYELDLNNPVVHMDLSYVHYKKKDYDTALKEANLALALEPGNSFAVSMAAKSQAALGAGKK